MPLNKFLTQIKNGIVHRRNETTKIVPNAESNRKKRDSRLRSAFKSFHNDFNMTQLPILL